MSLEYTPITLASPITPPNHLYAEIIRNYENERNKIHDKHDTYDFDDLNTK